MSVKRNPRPGVAEPWAASRSSRHAVKGRIFEVPEDVDGHHREPDDEAGFVCRQEQARVRGFDGEEGDAGAEQRQAGHDHQGAEKA